jgi:UDP-glucose 4-epimerase
MMAIREDHPLSPISPYAASKMACEGYAKAYCELGLDTVALRFFNVFGPRQDSSSPYSGVIAKFADKMKKGERPVVYGDGLQTRDFCHVSNVVRACVLAGGHQGKLRGIAINVGCSVPSTVLNVVDGLNAALGTKLDPIHEPAKPGDPRHSLADISLARSALGYDPVVGLEEGLRTVVNVQGGS